MISTSIYFLLSFAGFIEANQKLGRGGETSPLCP